MEYLNLLYNDLKELGIAHPYLALGLNTILIALFFIQLYYYLSVYGSLPHFRNNRGIRKDIPTPPISVIIVIRENSYYFIEEILPLLLQQQYDAFEIVLVDCSYDDEIAEIMKTPIGTVRSRIFRARQFIEEQMAKISGN